MSEKRYLTEYDNVRDGGSRYAGPILTADTQAAAEAIVTCVHGPNGEALRVIGELVQQVPAGEDTQSWIRPQLHLAYTRES